jgi:hypothetical protein
MRTHEYRTQLLWMTLAINVHKMLGPFWASVFKEHTCSVTENALPFFVSRFSGVWGQGSCYFNVCYWKLSVVEKFSDSEQKFACTIVLNTKPERCFKLSFFFWHEKHSV